MVPAGASKNDIIVDLQTYLYLSGPWNGQQPFKYDVNDPYGREIHNKLLSTHLSTRRGNCILMPLLFIALGQKLGLSFRVNEEASPTLPNVMAWCSASACPQRSA